MYLENPATLDHTSPMLASLFGRCIGLFAVLCVVLLFFFPLPAGPFPVTHGPATALRASHYLVALLVSIVAAALHNFSFGEDAQAWSFTYRPAIAVLKTCNSRHSAAQAILRC